MKFLFVSKEDLVSIGKGALIAGVGASLAYIGQWISGHDLGQAAPVVALVLSVLTNYLRKLTTQGADGSGTA